MILLHSQALNRFLILCLSLVLTVLWQSRSIAVPVEDDAAHRDYRDQLPHIAPTEPADVHTTFRTEPGFKVELVAAEPLIADPVAAAFDELGRLYVVEMCDYSEDPQLNPNFLVEDEISCLFSRRSRKCGVPASGYVSLPRSI